MQEAQPSQTALRVALRRAAHQVVDAEPLVFRDPFALRTLDSVTAEEIKRTPSARRRPFSAAMRAWVVARARFAEDTLAEGVSCRGVAQYLLLGAGLDTFALRNPFPGVRVFEVDHPATQMWKRARLASAGLRLPETACFVPVDFETQSLREQLGHAGFSFAQPTMTAWLGVSMYLTRDAFAATVRVLSEFARGSGSDRSALVMDYLQPRAVLPPTEQLMQDSLAARVAQAGEPFRLHFTPEALAADLTACGWRVVEDLGDNELNMLYFSGRSDDLAVRGGGARLCHATPAL